MRIHKNESVTLSIWDYWSLPLSELTEVDSYDYDMHDMVRKLDDVCQGYKFRELFKYWDSFSYSQMAKLLDAARKINQEIS